MLVSRVDSKNFDNFFLLSGPAFEISFLQSLKVNSTKLLRYSPMLSNKDKKVKH